MKLNAILAAAAAALSCLGAQAADTLAIANATVQPAGIRTGSNGLAFLNVEGSANGSFASYGAMRFDLASVKSQFDAQYGAGGWAVSKITLQLTQSNSAFTADGDVGVYFTDNDSVALTSPSPLTYDAFATSFPDAARVLGYTFHATSTGAVDSYTLFDQGTPPTAGGSALAADALDDSLTTLLLRDESAGVAATYAGITNFSGAGPTLQIEAVAAVPEPASLALFVAGLAAVAIGARRGSR
jgi:hypothetical protein